MEEESGRTLNHNHRAGLNDTTASVPPSGKQPGGWVGNSALFLPFAEL